MATPSFDLSGLPLLEAAIAAMVGAQAATPSTFTGAASFTATYKSIPQSPPTTETTSTINQRLVNLKAAQLQAAALACRKDSRGINHGRIFSSSVSDRITGSPSQQGSRSG